MSQFFEGERVELDLEGASDADKLVDPVETEAAAAGPAAPSEPSVIHRRSPVVVLVIGMAGSGKSTLMHRINLHVVEKGLRGYFINLDPAVKNVSFGVNIDIRDTVNYKEVMSQYGLGPNGAILTSLNLFATRLDQVVGKY
jgi:hypothetical protein